MTPDCITPLIIPSRFNGPATSGNGGYVAGAIAARLAALTGVDDAAGPDAPPAYRAVEVTLRAPTPLDVPLRLQALGDAGLSLHAGETLIAEARPTTLPQEVPPAPDLERSMPIGVWSRPSGFPTPRCLSMTAAICDPRSSGPPSIARPVLPGPTGSIPHPS